MRLLFHRDLFIIILLQKDLLQKNLLQKDLLQKDL
jgi:hypothetical protein